MQSTSRKSGESGRFFLQHICFILLVLFAGSSCQVPAEVGESRLETRATLSGQVVLTDIPGLNDFSRVRVEIGRGEGGVTPERDGTFIFSDIEADVFPMRILYIGGLTADATESGYQDFERNVTVREGASVDLGQVYLELGLGTLKGSLDTGGEELSPGTTVILRPTQSLKDSFQGADEQSYESEPNEDGTFEIDSVQVGEYTLFVRGDGVTSCYEKVVIDQHDQLVERPSFAAPSTTVRFSAGTDQIFGSDQSSEWFLQQGGITVNILASFATQSRHWIATASEEEKPDYLPFAGTVVLDEELHEGHNLVYFQFRDECGYESPEYELTLIYDTTGPTLLDYTLHNGASYSQSSTVSLRVEAIDDFSPTLQMRTGLCSTTSNASFVELDSLDDSDWSCDPPWDDPGAHWVPLAPLQTLTFDGTEGPKRVLTQVRDLSGNNSTTLDGAGVALDYAQAFVVVDTLPPANVSLVIGDGSGLISHAQTTVGLSAEGAAYFKLGTVAGLGGVPWEVFRETTIITFSPEDGDKLLYTRFKDLAGNVIMRM